VTEGNTLTHLARILTECWDGVLAAGAKKEFEAEHDDVTPRTMFYWLDSRGEDPEAQRLLQGLAGGEHDDTSLWEIYQMLALPMGKEREVLFPETSHRNDA
jgi:hypothetical protein